MGISLKHKFYTGIADSTDPKDSNKVKPSNWNDEHDLSLSSGVVVGRKSAGSGDAEELNATDLADLLDGEFQPRSGALDEWAEKTPPSGDIIGTTDSQTLTNKTLALSNNTVTVTASGTGATSRSIASKLGDIINVKDFGAAGDGTTNDTTSISNAIAALPSAGGNLFFPSGVYMVDPDALTLGDGTNSTLSTKNGIGLVGAACTPYLNTKGVVLKARGTGTSLLTIAGPIFGVRIENILLDCDGKVSKAIQAYSVNNSSFRNFSLQNFTSYGLNGNCRTFGAGAVAQSSRNVFENFFITSSVVVDFGAGIILDGYATQAYDWFANDFSCGIIQINGGVTNPTRAIHLKFCDSNNWYDVDALTVGGTGKSVLFDGSTLSAYPQNNYFYQCSFESGTQVSGTIAQNYFIGHTTKDSEPIPSDANLIGFTDNGAFFGAGLYTSGVTGGNKGADTVNATTLYEAGTELSSKYQGLDATLTALAAFNTNGILTQTAADTFAGRTLTGTANEVTVTNGNGVSGNPTVSLPSSLTFTGKTITGGTFASPAITGTIPLVLSGNATTSADAITLKPTDFGSGKPGFFFTKDATATSWTIGLYDTVGATGTIRVNATVVAFPNIQTTASAANAFVDNSASNSLLRSTSSQIYKTQIETLEPSYADKIFDLRPVWYRSLCEMDPKNFGYYGFIAEEVAEHLPQLVHYSYHDDQLETVHETIEVDGETRTVEHRVPKEGAVKVPDAVQYDRLTALLVSVVQRQDQRIRALERILKPESSASQ